MKNLFVYIFSSLIMLLFLEVKYFEFFASGESRSSLYTHSALLYPLLILPVFAFIIVPALAMLEEKINGKVIYLKVGNNEVYSRLEGDTDNYVVHLKNDNENPGLVNTDQIKEAISVSIKKCFAKGGRSLRPLVFFGGTGDLTAEQAVIIHDAIIAAGAHEARFTTFHNHNGEMLVAKESAN